MEIGKIRDKGTRMKQFCAGMVVACLALLATQARVVNSIKYDSGHLLEHFPPEHLAFYSQSPPLIIVEQNTFFAEHFSEHTILGSKVFDPILLSMVYPASEDQE
jgi:hypothetical protein